MYRQNFVGGKWIDGGAGRIAVDDPASGAVFAEQACADAGDIGRAVAAARDCHRSGALSSMRPCERGRMVRGIGERLLQRRDEIALCLTRESGKPLWEAHLEIEGTARYFEYYGNQAETLEGRSVPLGSDCYDFTVYEPYGVSAQIVPWNYPLEMTARSLAPALATGNACVVKTPELDPLSNGFVAEAVEAAGFPEGAVNLLCGVGKDAGAALAAHAEIAQIVFTGSVATGISVATNAARHVVPCLLELGGKSAAVVHRDADLQRLVDSVRWGIFFNAGQVCSALARLIVHRDIYEEVVEAVVGMAESLSVGAGIERPTFGANMGAMISAQQRERARLVCQEAVAEGAVLATGGDCLQGEGYFFAPTVFKDVTTEMKIAQEEVFAPVLAVMRAEDEEQALAMANDSPYGLVAGVFTENLEIAMRLAQGLRAGQVFVNEWYAGGVETPFGGYGRSGYGREKGREALWNYVQTKNIAIAMKQQQNREAVR